MRTTGGDGVTDDCRFDGCTDSIRSRRVDSCLTGGLEVPRPSVLNVCP